MSTTSSLSPTATLTLRNLAANKARLVLTGLAIVLGVGFVVASFITSDGLRASFDGLSRDIASGADLTVRPDEGSFGTAVVIDDDLVASVGAIDGVAVAEGDLSGFVQPIAPDGTPLPTQGAPLIGVAWPTDDRVNPSTLVEGSAPGPGQFVMDVDTAAAHGFVAGESYELASVTGTHRMELSGLHRFGETNDLLGASLTAFTADDARTILGTDPGTFDDLVIALEDGVSAATVEAAVADVLPAGLEVVNQQTVQQEQAGEFNGAISVIRNIFLGFAAVSLFVSIFIIYNTFGVVLAQRVRQIGLLRAVGATPGQIRRSILGESLVIGVVASTVGIGVGIGLNRGLLALFEAVDMALPPTELILAPRTIVIGLIVGIGSTVVSALIPALRAGSVSPIVAIAGRTEDDNRDRRRVSLIGIALVAFGVAAGALGFQGLGGTSMVVAALAVGALAVFVGVTLLSPLAAGPIIGAIRRPLSLGAGPAGDLAAKNATRHPGRTATTAGSLMIGLALITTALVVGDSFKAQVSETLASTTTADYLIEGDWAAFDPSVIEALEAMPELGTVASFGYLDTRTDATTAGSEQVEMGVADLAAVTTLFDLSIDRGVIDAGTAADTVLLPSETADDYGYHIGDRVPVTFADGASGDFTLVATFTDETLVNGGVLNRAGVDAIGTGYDYYWASADVADGFSTARAESAMDQVLAPYPQIGYSTADEYQAEIEGQIDSMMNAVTVMLALAILIALVGIGLTLALAIVERTREIGLLRAVGMTRRQTRRMIRWEAAAIATFGAVLGIAIGLVFGWGAVTAIPDEFMQVMSIPAGRLAIMMVAAAVAGLVAALLPARRAGRLNVLDAIATG